MKKIKIKKLFLFNKVNWRERGLASLLTSPRTLTTQIRRGYISAHPNSLANETGGNKEKCLISSPHPLKCQYIIQGWEQWREPQWTDSPKRRNRCLRGCALIRRPFFMARRVDVERCRLMLEGWEAGQALDSLMRATILCDSRGCVTRRRAIGGSGIWRTMMTTLGVDEIRIQYTHSLISWPSNSPLRD
jgi:hypothetical protein